MSNNGGVYTWSKTPANNASADSTVNYAEGQAPSSLNDSARAAMSSVAKWRDDISGAIVTTGTAQNYIVSSNQNFDSKADFDGQIIAFTPHATNIAGPVTMTVDGFANLPVRSAPNAELLQGVLIAGTPYVAKFNNTDGALYLQGFYGNPFNIPLAGGLDYWAPTAPNSSFAFPVGQAISRTTYAALFALIGGAYGSGDGSTTFNLPDKRGRVSAALDPTGTILNTATMNNGNVLGGVGGAQLHTLTAGEIPTITSVQNAGFNVSVNSTKTDVISLAPAVLFGSVQPGSGGGIDFNGNPTIAQLTSTGTVAAGNVTSTSNNTGGAAHINVQPTIMCNYIMRII